ncbi:helix-turn-helix transcriptional regulator [Legionella fairfieldensis]|uniref:helix-turn-helix transcriptional regulator n=1 Tax=Legionella fairfieldensis TaxID=45064 RepID=UPI00055E50B4|nr:helix-turn-helix transcriptional regulator [Legionella fairfieldensis]
MCEIPYILSLAYRTQIDEVCKSLPSMGLDHMVMYLVFNDGRVFVLSNVYSILKPYYQEALYQHDYTYTLPLIQSAKNGYYLCQEAPAISNELNDLFDKKYKLYPIYNIVRPHAECTFIFSAIRKNPIDRADLFYKKTVKSFESFCIHFVDTFLDLILKQNPAYRFSFVLTNKRLRDAVIRQGYENEVHLTWREQECLWYLGLGYSVKETANLLNISPSTVKTHLEQVRQQFNCAKIPEIMMECLHRGIFGKNAFTKNHNHSNYVINNVPSQTIRSY